MVQRIYNQEINHYTDEEKIGLLFKITKLIMYQQKIQKVYYFLFNFFTKFSKRITNLTQIMIKNILNYWILDLQFLQTLYQKQKHMFNTIFKSITLIQDCLSTVNQIRDLTNYNNFINNLFEFQNKFKLIIEKKYNLKNLLTQMKYIKPLKSLRNQQNQINMNQIRFILDILSPILTKILVHLSKWGDYQNHLKILSQFQSWLIIGGVMSNNKLLITFLKGLVYMCLPKKDQKKIMSEKSMKSIQCILVFFHKKIYILDIDQITIILKLIQAIEIYFINQDQELVTLGKIMNFQQIQQDVLNIYRINKNVFKKLFHNSDEVNSSLLMNFFQGLTQVALDTLNKITLQADTNEILIKHTLEFKCFCLQKMFMLITRNYHRLNEYWQNALNIFLIFIKNRDFDLKMRTIKIFNEIIYQYLQIQNQKQQIQINKKNIEIMIRSYLQLLANCQNQSISINAIGHLFKISTNFTQVIINSMKTILTIIQIQLKKYIKQKKIIMFTQNFITFSVNQIIYIQNSQLFTNIINIVKYLNQKQNKKYVQNTQYIQWKILGMILMQLINLKIDLYQKDYQADIKSQRGKSSTNTAIILTKNNSCKQFTKSKQSQLVQFKYFQVYVYQVLVLINKSFLDSKISQKNQYLKILDLHFIPSLKLFRYNFLINQVIPIFNKMFAYQFDSCVIITQKDIIQTPNFTSANKLPFEHQQIDNYNQYYQQQLIFGIFLKNIYLVLESVVVSNLVINWYKNVKIVQQIIQTISFVLNQCLSKQYYKLVIKVFPHYAMLICQTLGTKKDNNIILNLIGSLKNIKNCLQRCLQYDIYELKNRRNSQQIKIFHQQSQYFIKMILNMLKNNYIQCIQVEQYVLQIYICIIKLSQKFQIHSKIHFQNISNHLNQKMFQTYINQNFLDLIKNTHTKKIHKDVYKYIINIKRKGQMKQFYWVYHSSQLIHILIEMKIDFSGMGLLTFCKQQLQIIFNSQQIQQNFLIESLIQMIKLEQIQKQTEQMIGKQINRIQIFFKKSKKKLRIIKVLQSYFDNQNNLINYKILLQLYKSAFQQLQQSQNPIKNQQNYLQQVIQQKQPKRKQDNQQQLERSQIPQNKKIQILQLLNLLKLIKNPQKTYPGNLGHPIQYLYKQLLYWLRYPLGQINHILYQLLIRLTYKFQQNF